MRLSEFDYQLPKELIAQYPLKERDKARLLVVNRQDGTVEHRIFKDIAGYVRADDLLVLNDTLVVPCRLIGRRASGGKVEVLLLEDKGGASFNALIRPARLRPDEEIIFNNGSLSGRITSKGQITFSSGDTGRIYAHGQMPLPPYIKRSPEPLDKEYYQTVYAKRAGAVAAPTAGLHFTEELLSGMRLHIAYLTLHVGHATFKPVTADEVSNHTMEPERFTIPAGTVAAIENARRKAGRIIAVGTTSCRALESCALGNKEGRTDLFIYPGFTFKLVDCLLTNFHLPKTTLYMLVCAFAGGGLIKKAYQEAIENKYRFYSYGDAMLII